MIASSCFTLCIAEKWLAAEEEDVCAYSSDNCRNLEELDHIGDYASATNFWCLIKVNILIVLILILIQLLTMIANIFDCQDFTNSEEVILLVAPMYTILFLDSSTTLAQ